MIFKVVLRKHVLLSVLEAKKPLKVDLSRRLNLFDVPFKQKRWKCSQTFKAVV